LKIFKTKAELRQWREAVSNQSIGLVPTMGALHAGHLSLVKKSQKECKHTVVSIFINKLQFGPNEDFNNYPRFIEQDIQFLKNENVDVLFCPKQAEIYSDDLSFQINEMTIAKKLEGKTRPDFFGGVCMVVLKLFNIIQPHYTYFGEKDIQQLFVVQKMIKDLNFPVVLRPCSTIRETNGLAMSSRNQYLSDIEQNEATILYQTLKKGKDLILEEKNNVDSIIKIMHQKIETQNIQIDYLEIRDLKTFEKIKEFKAQSIVIVGAIYYKQIRLIDNIILK